MQWIACIGVCISLHASRVSADAQGDALQTRFAIDDADPESEVPSAKGALAAPLQMGYWVMLVSDRAQAAASRGDYTAAVKYYRAIAKAVPDRSVGFTKMCAMYQAMGDWDRAVASCKTALLKQGVTVDDYARATRVLLAKKTALSPEEIADTDAVIAHLGSEITKPPANEPDQTKIAAQSAGGQALVERLRCELALRLQDRARLERCSSALQRLEPGQPTSVAFSFALALMRQDFDQAERLIATAQRSGVNDSGVQLMRREMQAELDRRPLLIRLLHDRRALAALAGVIAMLAGSALFARRRLALRTS
jgi:tetratricopeptide (TPR) repeat protein